MTAPLFGCPECSSQRIAAIEYVRREIAVILDDAGEIDDYDPEAYDVIEFEDTVYPENCQRFVCLSCRHEFDMARNLSTPILRSPSS